MTLPIVQVAQAIENDFEEVNVFTNEVPQDFATLPNLPICRVVELDMDYHAYASADPNYYTTYVQVDLWVTDLTMLEKYYLAIDKTMRADNIQCTYSTQTYDPDLEGSRRIVKRYTINNRVV
nr:MAG TPA: tail component [Caudoviricetes sp.]